MTESRKQFEKWCESIGLNKIAWHPYSDDIGETAWQAWQASRAAIVVSLPEPMWSESQGDEVVFYDSIKNELERIGVSYE